MIRAGFQIRAARAVLGLSRPDLARAAGLHPNAVAYWENTAVIPPPHPSGRLNKHEPYAARRIREFLESAGVCFDVAPGLGVSLCRGHNFLTIMRTRARSA